MPLQIFSTSRVLSRHAPFNSLSIVGNDSVPTTQIVDMAKYEIAPQSGINSAEILRINVGGASYRIRAQSLFRFETSLLAEFVQKGHEERLEKCDGFLADSGEFFFERSPRLFGPIFDLYLNGNLNKTAPSSEDFKNELTFWQIPNSVHPSLKAGNYDRKPNEILSFRQKLARGLDYPFCSIFAILYSLFSIAVILIGVFVFCLGTLPTFIEYEVNDEVKISEKEHISHFGFLIAEFICVLFFIFDFVLRCFVTSNKLSFLKSGLAIIDLLSFLPGVVMVIVSFISYFLTDLDVRVISALCAFRIFRLSRFNAGVQCIGIALLKCMKDVFVCFLLLFMFAVFYATIVYYLELDVEYTNFASIFDALWWAIVTLTTVGYGDMTPVTIGGKLVGSAACVTGILVFALTLARILVRAVRYL